MSKRTTIQAEEGLLLELRYLAKRQGTTLSHVIREALATYLVERQEAQALPSFVGVGEGERTDASERAEELLFREELEQVRQRRTPG